MSGDRGLGEVRAHIENGLGDAPGGGSFEEVDIYDDFQRVALQVIDPSVIRPLKVVLDGGNGMAGPMVGPILNQLPVELVETYWVPDGEFPDHEPNPLLPENREFIIRKVLETGADLGIAWDGDADRCFFIDGSGEFVPGDFLTALLAASVLEKVPGADILYDVRASRAVPDTVERLGGRALVNRVGHAFFKTRMRDEGGEFGGEVSGHYYFKSFYNADSGTIPALLILELLSKRETTLVELLSEFRSKYFISGEINSTVEDQAAKMDEIKRRLRRRRDHRTRRHLDRLRGLALQRPPVQHRAAAAPEPRIAHLAGGHGTTPRRTARIDSRLTHQSGGAVLCAASRACMFPASPVWSPAFVLHGDDFCWVAVCEQPHTPSRRAFSARPPRLTDRRRRRYPRLCQRSRRR